ncbi:MAG TPA: ATP-binding protein [Trebonia sp.]|nr:ATP-binding protein [Trebonia sp.]
MPLAVPGTAEGRAMQPSRAASDKDGITMLDREFGAASLSGLRAAVLECASAAGLTDDRALDVMLAMHELAANVVRHGAGRGRLLMRVSAGALRCEVSDAQFGKVPDSTVSGPLPTTPLIDDAAADAPVRPSWPVEHGHGLWLVRRTADQVQVTTGPAGSLVSVLFSLPGRFADR